MNVVNHEQWLEARKALLAREKAFTKLRDLLNEERRRLPMVEVTADYRFDGPKGEVSLVDLFAGRSQLLVYHFMFHRDQGQGCPGCSFVVDNIGHQAHMQARDTNLVLVSRAPLAEIEPFKKRMGWTLPWFSSFNSRFNYDFHVTLDESVAPVQYNYRDKAELQRLGLDHHANGEQPGVSVFLRDGEKVLHTYSTYGRGLDLLDGTNNWLDLTPFGRREGWDGMPDLNNAGKYWWKLHDQYEQPAGPAHSCCSE